MSEELTSLSFGGKCTAYPSGAEHQPAPRSMERYVGLSGLARTHFSEDKIVEKYHSGIENSVPAPELTKQPRVGTRRGREK